MIAVAVCEPAVHERLKTDPAAWASLKDVGVQLLDGAPLLELRNCACGSTLARLCDGACLSPDEED